MKQQPLTNYTEMELAAVKDKVLPKLAVILESISN
jgi:hypothetical protein